MQIDVIRQPLTGHPAAGDVLHVNHAFGQVSGADVKLRGGDVSDVVVQRQAVLGLVAVDVEVSHEGSQDQGHFGWVLELGLEGDVGVDSIVGFAGTEAVLACKENSMANEET